MIPVTRTTLPALDEYVEYLKRIWSTRWLTNDGELVKLLEAELKNYLGIKTAVASLQWNVGASDCPKDPNSSWGSNH